MADYHLTLTLDLQAPVLSQAVGALGFGYDMATLRDEKELLLPGSLIRGNLRDALTHFADVLRDQGQTKTAQTLARNLQNWFGPKTDETEGRALETGRARLNFDYYWRCPVPGGSQTPRHRITINPKTGTVAHGALVVIESPAASGDRLAFRGQIRARFDSDGEAREARRWLEKAALFVPALGSLKGVGFGKVLGAKLTLERPVTYQPLEAVADHSERIGLMLRLDRPFCVAKPRTADANSFASEETLPGGVLKGAFANSLEPAQKAALCLDQLVFTHAVPAKADGLGRARVLPLSLAWAGDGLDKGNLVDLALLETGCVRTTAQGVFAPKFQIDWKGDEEDAARALIETVPTCAHHLAVHTAINSDSGQSDEDKLFSLDCVHPEYRDKDGKIQTMTWCADIDLSGLDKNRRAGVMESLRQALARPLSGIGKTKAVATVALAPAWLDDETPAALEEGGLYIISLQTAALLFDDANTKMIGSSGGENALSDVYKAYWLKASDGKLELLRYFAAQQRVGGRFLWRRYQKKQAYRPFWLTVPGSVFVLKARQPVDDLLNDWRRRGLPLPEGGESHSLWDENPYIRENGYGEIRINDPLHTRFEAKGEWS